MTFNRLLRRLSTPIVIVLTILYLLIDALFLWIIQPFVGRLAHLAILARLRRWVESLGPYPTLALLIVPIIVLEPVKPIGFYLMATGRFWLGVVLIALGEILKIVTVERLFHMSRDKLLTIPVFAWGYGVVQYWLGQLKALPAWRMVVKAADTVKVFANRLVRQIKEYP
jgi:hypothetical protein